MKSSKATGESSNIRATLAPCEPLRANVETPKEEPRGANIPTFDRDLILRLVRDSRREQGLSERISDQSVIARLSVLVGGGRR